MFVYFSHKYYLGGKRDLAKEKEKKREKLTIYLHKERNKVPEKQVKDHKTYDRSQFQKYYTVNII